jgi:hypothetical protein
MLFIKLFLSEAKKMNEEIDSLDVEVETPWKKKAVVNWSVMNSWSFPETKWRIKNLIPREGFVILASISGESKTWLALEMAKSIALGADFLDDSQFKTLEGNVLYIDAEMSKSEMQRRGRQLGLSEKNSKLFILSDDVDFQKLHSDDLWWLETFIRENKISTVFIDTFRAVAGGLDELKAEKVREFFNGFKSFKDMGVAIVFLDHQRKPNHFEGKVPKKEHVFASQDKIASVEILLMIKRDESGENIDCYQRKNRLGKEFNPFRILMTDEIDDQSNRHTILKYGGELIEDDIAKDKAKDFILTMLTEQGRTRKEVLTILSGEVKIGERNISQALRELVDQKKIKVKKQGKQNYYYLGEEENIPEKDSQQEIDAIFDSL